MIKWSLLSIFMVFSVNSAVKMNKNRAWMIHVEDDTTSEVSIDHFHQISTLIYALFYQEAKDTNRSLKINLEWETPYFSAWASHQTEDFYINFWGGFARIPGMLIETWEFVVCHEVGHIIAGHPYQAIKDSKWASTEGQSDHFAVTKCLPKYYRSYNKTGFDSRLSYPYEIDICLSHYDDTVDQNICLKILRAGRGFADVLKYLSHTDKDLSYKTPEGPTSYLINKSYPTAQCRIDIFLNGSLCLNKDECRRNNCWYIDESK